MKPYYQDDAVTIYHGDCREILPTLPKVDMVFTDPPYGHGNQDGDLQSARVGVHGARQRATVAIQNDRAEATPLFEAMIVAIASMLRHGGCCCCCCGGGGPDPMFARWSLIIDTHLDFKQMVIWDKTGRGPGMGWHYRRDYETILVAERRGGPTRYFGPATSNIVCYKPLNGDGQHPTEKPSELPAHFILLHSKTGDTILDPFSGSGTTLRAAKDLGRKAIGIEIEEKYCEIAARRCAQEVMCLS